MTPADAAQCLRDLATLDPLAWALAWCRDSTRERVLRSAWYHCRDPVALAMACAAVRPDAVRVKPREFGAVGYRVIMLCRRFDWYLRPSNGPTGWRFVRDGWGGSSTYETYRASLGRAVPLRALAEGGERGRT